MLDTPTKNVIYLQIGQRLRALREQNGLKQAEVAELIGKSHQTYSNYEKADNHITLDCLYTLSSHYGVPVTDLLPDDQLIASLFPDTQTESRQRGVAEEQTSFAAASLATPDRLADAGTISSLFLNIRDDKVRRDLIALARSISAI